MPRMNASDAREMMKAAFSRNTNTDYTGIPLEELEAMADELGEAVSGMKRTDPQWNQMNNEIRRIEDRIFAITG